MLALDYRKPYHVRIEGKPRPEIVHPNDVIIRVTRCVFCQNQLYGNCHDSQINFPLIKN